LFTVLQWIVSMDKGREGKGPPLSRLEKGGGDAAWRGRCRTALATLHSRDGRCGISDAVWKNPEGRGGDTKWRERGAKARRKRT
jgi:hypothetical protein